MIDNNKNQSNARRQEEVLASQIIQGDCLAAGLVANVAQR